ncbi:annexin A5a [Notothenia coriiceps]|uniref:Annexin n=1 Tax=Notothenia coriiceps TaxID=8208 RepID=A0A6I9PAD6_9TELE|nr:PREDICTED: annexin A5 [Notothenia coriiceps]
MNLLHFLPVYFVCFQSATIMAYRGSVRPFVNFNPKHDAEILHAAMKGLGTHEDTILMLLTSRSNDQRQDIKAVYKKVHGKDLVSALKSELGGHFESLIVALMTPPVSYDASQLHKALKGLGTEDEVLIEILASRTGEQITNIVKAYKKEFNRKLENDILGDTSGHYQRLLVVLLQGSREDGLGEENIDKDAKALFDAGEGKFGTDEEQFITILGNRRVEHLRKGECLWQHNICQYRAGTDDSTLTRIMVSRSEIDMLDIRTCFKKKYGASLYTTIQEDTDGDYQKALLYLCGGND